MFRRLLRWGFHFAAALSLVLCLATVMLRARSRLTCHSLVYFSADRPTLRGIECQSWSQHGQLCVEWTRRTYDTPNAFQRHLDRATDLLEVFDGHAGWEYGGARLRTTPPPPSFLSDHGFCASVQRTGPSPVVYVPIPNRGRLVSITLGRVTTDRVLVMLPHWFVAAALAVPPLGWACWLRRRWRSLQGNLCRHCGYDLRGNPAARACPECGTPIPNPRAAGAPARSP